jgi:adenosylcobinamide-phosphate synthase
MLLSIWEPQMILAGLAVALVLDALVGDPRWLPHPVAAAGAVIGWVDTALNRPEFGAGVRRGLGVATVLVLLTAAAAVGWGLSRLFALAPSGGWLIEGVCVALLLAQRSLYDHVRAVRRAFESGLQTARGAVAHIVGRDSAQLDEPGICRAAIESLAENQSDGVVAPVFWYLLFGLPGLLAYKTLNTADSMIGYRSERHRAFGWAAARLDDLANYLPARLSALMFVATAGRRVGDVWRTTRHDGPRHDSVNAGWPEAAMAGALGLALAGPRSYGGTETDGAWMNHEGRRDATPEDIGRALRRYLIATSRAGYPEQIIDGDMARQVSGEVVEGLLDFILERGTAIRRTKIGAAEAVGVEQAVQVAAGDPAIGGDGAVGPTAKVEERARAVRPIAPPKMDLVPAHRLAGGEVAAVGLDQGLVAGQCGLDVEQAEPVDGTGCTLDTVRVVHRPAQHLVSAAEPQHPATATDMGQQVDVPALLPQIVEVADRRLGAGQDHQLGVCR